MMKVVEPTNCWKANTIFGVMKENFVNSCVMEMRMVDAHFAYLDLPKTQMLKGLSFVP